MAAKLCFIEKYWKNCGESWSERFVNAQTRENTVYDKTFFLKLLIAIAYVIYTVYVARWHISVFAAVLETMPAEALALVEVGRCSSFSWRSTQQATFIVLFTSMGFTEIFIQPAFDLPELSSHIPYATAETLAFQDAQNRNLAVIYQSHFWYPPFKPFILFLLTPTRAPIPHFSTFSDIIMEAPCRCSFFPPTTHILGDKS